MIINKLKAAVRQILPGYDLPFGSLEQLNAILCETRPYRNANYFFAYMLGETTMVNGCESGEVSLNMAVVKDFDARDSDLEQQVWDPFTRGLDRVYRTYLIKNNFFYIKNVRFRRYRDAFAANLAGVEMRMHVTECEPSWCVDFR